MTRTPRDIIYEYSDGIYSPTRWAGSPWSTSTQHGGPVNGLFAREAESVAAELGMHVARLTVDLFKPVPLIPLRAETRRLRQGGRIAALESVLVNPETEDPVSRATALLLRPDPHEGTYWTAEEAPPPPFNSLDQPAREGAPEFLGELPPGFHQRVENRSGHDAHGAFTWMAANLDLVDAEPISTLQRAAALTDVTLGFQMQLNRREPTREEGGPSEKPGAGLMINTDTTVYWERPFVGEQIGFRPLHLAERNGIGTAEAILYDAQGRVGRSIQCALVQGRSRLIDKPAPKS